MSISLQNDPISPVVSRMKTQARRSTFHRWPQYLFPSSWNNLPSDLEAPYAFSHHTGSFFWTRDDALSDVKWNIWAKPPCLNCIVKGESKAKSCDRMRRQCYSFGFTTCCSTCQQDGKEDRCIETIEQRIDTIVPAMIDAKRCLAVEQRNGHESARTYDQNHGRAAKTALDEVSWMESEKELRKIGLIIWKPINLNTGDVEAKAEIVERFERGGGANVSRSSFTENPERFRRKTKGRGLQYDIRDNMRRIVADWESAEQIEGVQVKRNVILTAPNTTHSTSEPIPETADSASDAIIGSRELSLQDVCDHWSFKLKQAQVDLYELEVRGLGRRAADRTAERWARDVEEILPQVQVFLTNKMKAIVEGGVGIDEANDAAAATLTEKARYWFRKLVSEMMTT